MPIGKAMVQVRNSAENDTAIVSQSRSPMTSVTGRRHIMDTPKSPTTTRLIHMPYWMMTG